MKVATLNEMLEEVVRLGEATGTGDQAHELRGELEGRLATVRAAVAGATVPRVVALERLIEPVRVAGLLGAGDDRDRGRRGRRRLARPEPRRGRAGASSPASAPTS